MSVSFKVDLDAAGAADAGEEFADAIVEIVAAASSGDRELDKLIRQMRKLRGPANEVERVTKGLGGKKGMGGGGDFFGFAGGIATGTLLADVIKNIASAAFNAAKALAVMGVKAAIAFTSAVADAAMSREKSILALGVLRGGGVAGGTAEFEKIKETAIQMGVPLDEAAKQFQKLAAMQFSPKDADTFFKRMQDLKAIGASADEVGRAMLAITQIKSKGKMQGEEMLQLAEAGVSLDLIYAELEKQTGKTREEVMALQQAGKISADMGLDAIEKAIGKKVGGKAAGKAAEEFMDTTLSGLVQRIQGFKSILLDDIAAQLGPELKAVKPMLDDIMKALRSEEAKVVIGEVAAGFRLMLNGAKAAWPAIKAFVGGFAEAFGPVWKQLKEAGGAMLKAFGGGDAKQGMADLIVVARVLGVVLAHTVGFMIALGGLAGGVVAGIALVFGKLSQLIMRAGELAGEFMAKGSNLGSQLVNGLVAGITGGAGKVMASIKGLASGMMGGAEKTLDVNSPSGEFEWIGEMVGEGFAGGVDFSAPAANDAMTAMVTPPAPASGGSGGGGGSRTYNISITVTGNADPEAIAEAMRREVEAINEREALERGAA